MRQIIDTIKYVQKIYKADIFHFNIMVKRYEPHVWQEIEKDWHDIFPELPIEVQANVEVKAIGVMK